MKSYFAHGDSAQREEPSTCLFESIAKSVISCQCTWTNVLREFGPAKLHRRPERSVHPSPRSTLTGGEAHDFPLAKRLIRRVNPPEHLLGDMAYDGDELREELERHRTKSVIPNRPNRRHPFSFSKRLYKLRWRIESAFNRLKDFRRIATRYDKLGRNYLASVCLAAALYGGFNELNLVSVCSTEPSRGKSIPEPQSPP